MECRIERLPETIRIDLEPAGAPGRSVLVVPKPKVSKKFREFYLIDNETSGCLYMFGLEIQSDYQALDIAAANGPDYIQEMEEMRWVKN